jgi:hypothetical protein
MFPVDLFSLNEVADVQPFSITLERESKNAMVIFKIALLFTFLRTALILSYWESNCFKCLNGYLETQKE